MVAFGQCFCTKENVHKALYFLLLFTWIVPSLISNLFFVYLGIIWSLVIGLSFRIFSNFYAQIYIKVSIPTDSFTMMAFQPTGKSKSN
jgi:hypothetical protein